MKSWEKSMKIVENAGSIFLYCIFASLPASWVWADGGYFSRSIAASADQRAIIIKNGDEISMTFSTGYTGEGDVSRPERMCSPLMDPVLSRPWIKVLKYGLSIRLSVSGSWQAFSDCSRFSTWTRIL
jgi:hypothetical protein